MKCNNIPCSCLTQQSYVAGTCNFLLPSIQGTKFALLTEFLYIALFVLFQDSVLVSQEVYKNSGFDINYFSNTDTDGIIKKL